MSFPKLAQFASPEGRTAVFYLTVFAIPGAMGTYLGIWLAGKGLTAGEIGWINSLPIFLMLLLNISVGRIADRAKDWRSVIIVGALVSGLTPAALYLVDDFWGILIVLVLIGVPFGLVTPVVDAAALRMTRRNGTNFAFVRSFGTTGYMLALAGTGWAVALWGGMAFIPVLLFISLSRAGLSLLLPRFRAPEGVTPAAGGLAAARLGQVMKPWFLLPVLTFALVQGTHYTQSAFGGLIWLQNGIGEVWIGPLLAVGALAEVAVMLLIKPLAGQMTARHLMLIGALTAAVRWAILALNPPLWVLFIVQISHGITFGFTYLGLMNFIANWTSEDVAAEAQSFAVVVQLGVVVLTLSGVGYLVELFGSGAYFAASGYGLLGALAVMISLRQMSAREGGQAAGTE